MNQKHGFVLILAAIFLKQLAWMVFMPLWQTPDEQAHFAQISVMSETNLNFVPPQNTSEEIITSEQIVGVYRDPLGNNSYTYHPEFNIDYTKTLMGVSERELTGATKEQRNTYVRNEATDYPYFYYLTSKVPYKLFDQGSLLDRVFAVRFLSVISLLLLCWVTNRIGKLVLNDDRTAWALTILVGFTPMLSFVHSGVTSDTFFNLLFTLFIWRCLLLINNGLSPKELLITAGIVLLSFWTKPQANIMAFILVPLLGLIFIFQKRKDPRNIVLFIFLVGISLGGIMLRLLSGAPLIPETEKLDSLALSLPLILEHVRFTASHTYSEVLPWYWGVFRWLSLGLPDIIRKITNALTIVSFVGFALYLFSQVRNKNFSKTLLMQLFLLSTVIIYFAAITAFDFGFRQSHGYSFGIQGRYFFPVIVPLTIVMVLGLRHLRISPLVLAFFMIVFNVITFFWVTGSYYAIILPQFFIQASQYKPVWLKFPVNFLILWSYLSGVIAIIMLTITLLRKKTATIKP